MSRHFLTAPLVLVATLFTTVAAGATPGDVSDLVGARASTGDSALRDRGYVHITTQKSGNRSYGMWWNASRKTCITVQTKDGSFKSITDSPAFDCNQHVGHSDQDKDENAAAAAAVVGAAAVIGAIALAHKSHHHDNDEHHQDSYREQEFERGHRDGLYNHHYDNYNRTDDYDEGYRSGIDQRAHETSYRQHNGRDDRGYQKATDDFKNLKGEGLEFANDRMREWGFQKVDHTRSGGSEYRIWYNYQTGQCVEEKYARDRVEDIRYIHNNSHCR